MFGKILEEIMTDEQDESQTKGKILKGPITINGENVGSWVQQEDGSIVGTLTNGHVLTGASVHDIHGQAAAHLAEAPRAAPRPRIRPR